MRRHFIFCSILLLLLAPFGARAQSQIDFERERLWAEEIVPTIVEGEPMYLEVKGQPRFLNLYTKVPQAKAAVILLHGLRRHPDWAS